MNNAVRIFLLLLAGILLVISALVYLRLKRHNPAGPRAPVAAAVIVPSAIAEFKESPRIGEELVYDVKMKALRLGSAVFTRLPSEIIDGVRLQVMTFRTSVTRFKDTEIIYSDPKTFLPVRVERDIQKLISKEKITEHYDQKNFTLAVVTHNGREDTQVVIKRESPIQHPVLLPHYVRELPQLEIGDHFKVTLPKREYTMTVRALEDITVGLGTFKAWRIESDPAQIVIWISADQNRLPLRIEGAGVLNYALLLKEYHQPPAAAYSNTEVCIKGKCIDAQLADTPEKKSRGLSSREGLAQDQGMLFTYDQPDRYSFWMKDMRMPLDFIWISEGLEVVELMRNVPACTQEGTCPSFQPQRPVQYVLELPSGDAARLQIEVGDKVKLE